MDADTLFEYWSARSSRDALIVAIRKTIRGSETVAELEMVSATLADIADSIRVKRDRRAYTPWAVELEMALDDARSVDHADLLESLAVELVHLSDHCVLRARVMLLEQHTQAELVRSLRTKFRGA